MFVWQRTIVDELGNIVPFAEVSVRDQVTASLVQLYSDYDGETPIGNPIDADANGFVRFYVEVGRYQITAELGALSRVWEDVELGFHQFGDVTRYGLILDGESDDSTALQTAFSATDSAMLVFPPLAMIAITANLTIPAGACVDFNGATLIPVADHMTDSYHLSCGVGSIIKNLNFHIPAGITVWRALSVIDGCRAENISFTSEDQNNNLGAESRTIFRALGNSISLCDIRTENIDKAFWFQGDDLRVRQLRVVSYTTGLMLNGLSNFSINGYIAHTKSANASTAAGHNAMVTESIEFGKLSDFDMRNAGEHGVYLSGALYDVGFSNWHIEKSGQSGLKCSGTSGSSDRIQHLTGVGLEVIDCSFGNVAGQTEHALMLEYCDHIAIAGFTSKRIDDGDHCLHHIYIRDCNHVFVPGAVLHEGAGSAVLLTDGGLAEVIENVYMPNLTILGPGGCGVEINVATASSELDNIRITGLYVGSAGDEAVKIDTIAANINQPVEIVGTFRDAGGGAYNNVNSVTDVLLNVRLEGVVDRELATGTFTASIYIEDTVIDSSGGAVTVTLPDGNTSSVRRKKFTMSNATNSSTVSVTTHETSNPEVFTFAQTSDVLILEWTGSLWYTVKNIGVGT